MADSISTIIETLLGGIKIEQGQNQLPPPLILFGNQKKQGLSAIELTKNIISRKAEAGIPSGDLPDGSENIDNKFIYILCDEIIKHLQNAKFTVVVPSGTPVQAQGLDATGTPVTVVGQTVGLTVGAASIQ